LSAADGVHAVAYDAVVITVTNTVSLSIARAGATVNLTWLGGAASYVVQATDHLWPMAWYNVATTSVQNVSLPLTNATEYFRVLAQ